MIHSDQGTQFTSRAFTRRAIDSGLLPSMGVGNCDDNAMIESFWSRMQVELLDRRRWKTRAELANAIAKLRLIQRSLVPAIEPDLVNEVLQRATSRDEALEALDALRQTLINGGLR